MHSNTMPIFNDHRTKASLGQNQHDSIAVQSFWGSYSRWKRTWRNVTQSVSVEVAQREGRLQHYPMFCDNQINVPDAVFHGTISYAQRVYQNNRTLPQTRFQGNKSMLNSRRVRCCGNTFLMHCHTESAHILYTKCNPIEYCVIFDVSIMLRS